MDKEKKSGFGNYILVALLVVAAFLIGSMWTEKRLAQKKPSEQGQAAGVTGTPTATTPLSISSLKKYAQDLGLDTKKFDSCLDAGQKAEEVKKEADLGSSLGVKGTPAFFINGRFLGGAFPFEMFKEIIDKELAGKGSDLVSNYSKELQDAAKDGSFISKAAKVELTGSDAIKGPAGAKVTIVEYSDFECPFCGRAMPTIKKILETYPDNVRLVFRQYPLPFHQYAQKAAEASLCAKDQGKFWEYHDQLFASQAAE